MKITEPIPGLELDDQALVPPDTLTRSYPSGRRRFLRRYRGDSLCLKVRLEAPNPDAQLILFTNLLSSDSTAWEELPVPFNGTSTFSIDIPLERRGRFGWRAKYSADGGKTWSWDRVPVSWVMVDPEQMAKIKVYTLIPSVSGTWRDWVEMLPHIRSLGCNVIHLLPLTSMDSSQSPYSASDLFAFEPAFCDPTDPRTGLEQAAEFADKAAEQGLSICVDLVFNHVGISSLLARRHPEWLSVDEKEPDGFRRAGWQGPDGWNAWRDLAYISYAQPDEATRKQLWEYMRSYARTWATLAHRSGGMVRLDNLHSSHEGFTRYLLDDLRSQHPDLIILAELFASEETNERLIMDYGLNLLLGTQWEHHFTPDVRSYLTYIHQRGNQVRYFLPVSTHDSGTPADEFGDARSTLPRYAISCFYGHGLTGLVQGVEHGQPEKLEFIGKPEKKELPRKHDFTKEIRAFHDILDAHDIFSKPGNLLFIDGDHDAILAAWRGATTGIGEGFILLVNLDINNQQALELDFQRFGMNLAGRQARDLVGREIVDLLRNKLKIVMPPCGVKVIRVAKREN